MGRRIGALCIVLITVSGCAAATRRRPEARTSDLNTTVRIRGAALTLHVTAPRMEPVDRVIVLYASGDGGWSGTATDMFREIGDAGYYAVGFSSRALLRIARPRGKPATAADLAAEYEQILARGRDTLGLDPETPAILTGWSRGAAFAVLVGSEPEAPTDVIGVIAIGLDESEDLIAGPPEEATDEGPTSTRTVRRTYDTYGLIADHLRLPCVVIQATHDDYFPAGNARQRFGPDTPRHRFYAVEARNHRFAGGKPAFDATLRNALRWMMPRSAAAPDEIDR